MASKILGDLLVRMRLDKSEFTAGMKGADTQVKNMVSDLGSMVAGVVSVGAALALLQRSFMDFGRQETAINRVVAAMRGMGLSTEGVRGEMDKLGEQFIRMGQQEEAAWMGYQRLIQATKNRAEAQRLLNDALAFSIMQGKPVEEVITALTAAYAGNDRMLKMLVSRQGEAGKSAKSFADALKMLRELGKGSGEVLSAQERAVYGVKAAWDQLMDTLGKEISPTVEKLLTRLEKIIPHLWRFMVGPNLEKIGADMEEQRQRARGAGSKSGAGYDPPPWWITAIERSRSGAVRPPGGKTEPGNFVDPYASVRAQREELYDIMQRVREESAQRAADAAEEERKALVANYNAVKEYEQALKEWDIRQSPAFQGALAMSDLFGDTLVNAMTDFEHAFDNLGRSLMNILGQIISRIIQMRTLQWAEGAFGLSPGSLTGQPQRPTFGDEGNDSGGGGTNIRSFGGYQPLGVPGGGAVPVNVYLVGDAAGMFKTMQRAPGFAAHSEATVTSGMTHMRLIGR